jgi:hypothetical protein
LEAELALLGRQRDELVAGAEQQQDEHQAELVEREKLDARLSELETRLSGFCTQLESARQQHAAAEHQWSEQERTLASELDDADRRYAELEAKYESQLCQFQQLNDQYATRIEETELQARLADQQLEHESREKEWLEDRRRLEQELEDHRTQFEQIRDEVERIRQPECDAPEATDTELPAQLEEIAPPQDLPSTPDGFGVENPLDGVDADPIAELPTPLDPPTELPDLTESMAEGKADESQGEEVPSTGAPVSTADVLARLGHSGLWNEEDNQLAEETDVPATGELPPPSLTDAEKDVPCVDSNPVSPGGGEDEDSIEEYMSSLLQRLRGPSEPSAQSAVEPITPRQPITEIPLQSELRHDPLPAESDGGYVPRSHAPEIGTSLAAMRELANNNARTAIATHRRTSLSNRARHNFWGSMAVLCLAGSMGLIFCDNHLIAGLGIGVSVFAVVFWAVQAVTVSHMMRRTDEGEGNEDSRADLESAGRTDVVEVSEMVSDADVVEQPTQPS